MSANAVDTVTYEPKTADPKPEQTNHNEPQPASADADVAPDVTRSEISEQSRPDTAHNPELASVKDAEGSEPDERSRSESDQKIGAPIEGNGEGAKFDDVTVVVDEGNGGGVGGESVPKRELKKEDAGSRTFTMRELLDELKTDAPSGNQDEPSEIEGHDTSSPYSRETSQQQIEENNAAMELINSVTGADEEGRSRQKILTFAARRYASAIERNPDDYDALYNWALVLQESADNVGPESGSSAKDALLEEACKKYEEATHLCPTLHDAYYNRAIAISDRAKMRGRTKEAEELWKQATYNYEKAVQLNWNTPQALNNWGLALQELSAIVPAREKQTIVKTAINKFRGAIALQFDFHRAIYNLGTVLYGLAEDISRMGGSGNVKDVSPDELYSLSAVYIAAAHALKPSYSVYTSALKLVRSMLPLPYLKVGYLTAPPVGNPVAPHSDWKRTHFVLDNEGLQQIHRIEHSAMSPSLSGRSGDTLRPAIRVDVANIVCVSACADLTLPLGAALCIDTVRGPVYLIADSWESLDGWLDAIRLVYTIFARGKSEVLAGIVTG